MNRLRAWWRLAVAALRSGSNTRFYDRIAAIYDRLFVDHLLHADRMADLVTPDSATGKTPACVLDLGAGTGAVSLRLADRGVRVLALDLSLASLRILRERRPDIEAVNADAMRLPLRDGCCQAVLSLGAWRHLELPEQAADEVTRVLAVDGVFVLGYFPPALAGLLPQRSGAFGALLARLYCGVTGLFGYFDRVDAGLEREALAITSARFRDVRTLRSGPHARLILARGVCSRSTVAHPADQSAGAPRSTRSRGATHRSPNGT